jgi:hypothetical protein
MGKVTGDGVSKVVEERNEFIEELVRVLLLQVGEECGSLGSHGSDHGRWFLRGRSAADDADTDSD